MDDFFNRMSIYSPEQQAVIRDFMAMSLEGKVLGRDECEERAARFWEIE